MNEVHYYMTHPKREISSLVIGIYHKGKQYKVPSGESVITKYWNPKKQRAKESYDYQDCNYLNNRLSDIDTSCREVLRELSLKLIVPTTFEMNALIRAKIAPDKTVPDTAYLIPYINQFIEGVHRARNTMKRYVTTRNNLVEYEKDAKIRLAYSDINMKFYNALHHWMDKKNYSLNYFGDMIKNIKVFYKAAKNEGLHDLSLPEKFKVMSEDTDSIYLNVDELKKLADLVIDYNLVLDNHDSTILKVKGNLDRMVISLIDCRDRFILGAYTALRFSDYVSLKNLKHTDQFISRKSEKTNTPTVIPMAGPIRDMLKRRNNKLPPVISNQKMNDQLKVLCRYAKIVEPIEVTITKGGMKKRETFDKCDLVTTHCARRSGATNMFMTGIDPLSIMKFTGHKTMKSFMAYIKASQQETAERLLDHKFFQ